MSLVKPLVMVGLPGSGKSTIGQAVAEELATSFIDFDVKIEAETGLSIAQLFATQGESAFRQRERSLTEALRQAPAAVWAPGGGWVTSTDLLARLRGEICMIYLKVSPEVALARVRTHATIRPLLANGDPIVTLRLLWRERRGLYETADLELDTESLTISQLVSEIAAFAELYCCGRPKD